MHPPQFLVRSIEFPDFCESSILQPDDPAMYTTCTGLTGYAVFNFTMTDLNNNTIDGCRIVAPTTCPAALVRVNDRTCRAVERRTWSCPATYRPSNQFGACYKVTPSLFFVPAPSCAGGHPDFTLIPCDDYVGGDFLASPRAVLCTSYVSVSLATSMRANTRTGPARDHWCQFNTAMTRIACHAAGANCTADWAFCLKRESQTGGCSGIGRTINCRSLQAQYADPNVNIAASAVRLEGCEPCLLLPFESVPNHCPDEIDGEPIPDRGPSTYQDLFRVRQDIRTTLGACRPVIDNYEDMDDHPLCKDAAVPCADPPAGRLSWSSTHHSQLPVVNSPVILHLYDLPTEIRTIGNNYILPGFRARESDLNVLLYPEPEADGRKRRLGLWQQPDPTTQATTIKQLVNTNTSPAYDCSLSSLPNFRVFVQELWPDDKTLIEALFGARSVDWWHNDLTSGEQERRTIARGLRWWNNLTPAEQVEERKLRREPLTEEVICNNEEGEELWCRWTPTRPGYYTLSVAGACACRPARQGNGKAHRHLIGSSERSTA